MLSIATLSSVCCLWLTQRLHPPSSSGRYYLTAASVLRKHSSVPSLHAILVEADEIIDGLKATLRKTLSNQSVSPGVLMGTSTNTHTLQTQFEVGPLANKSPPLRPHTTPEAIRLLLSLSEPRAALRQQFLDWYTAQLTLCLNSFRDERLGSTGPVEFITQLNDTFLDQLRNNELTGAKGALAHNMFVMVLAPLQQVRDSCIGLRWPVRGRL